MLSVNLIILKLLRRIVCKLTFFFYSGTTSPNPFDLGELRGGLAETGARPKKGVQSIIEEHSNLVNLDNLLTSSKNQGNLFFLSIVLTLCQYPAVVAEWSKALSQIQVERMP